MEKDFAAHGSGVHVALEKQSPAAGVLEKHHNGDCNPELHRQCSALVDLTNSRRKEVLFEWNSRGIAEEEAADLVWIHGTLEEGDRAMEGGRRKRTDARLHVAG